MKKYYPKNRKLSLSQISFYAADLINNGRDNAHLHTHTSVHPMKEGSHSDEGSKSNFQVDQDTEILTSYAWVIL